MKLFKFNSWVVGCVLVLASLGLNFSASAEMPDKRLSLNGGLGITQLSGSNQAFVAAGLEFEYRLTEYWGAGAFGNYVFSSPGVGILGAPQVYFHPLAGDWYINAAPMFQFGGGSTQVGARIGTRVPLLLGSVLLVPQVAVDFIGGGQNWWYGLSIGI